MDADAALRLQLDLRAEATSQADALASVGAWLSTIREKEAALLARRAARSAAPAPPPPPLPPPPPPPRAPGDALDALHAAGVAAIAAGDVARAASLFSRVVAARAPGLPAAPALANRCLAHLKLREYRAAIADASAVLRADAAHVKSWMRRAAARNALGQHALAAQDLAVARLLEPANRVVASDARKTAESAKAASRRAPDVGVAVVEEGEHESRGESER